MSTYSDKNFQFTRNGGIRNSFYAFRLIVTLLQLRMRTRNADQLINCIAIATNAGSAIKEVSPNDKGIAIRVAIVTTLPASPARHPAQACIILRRLSNRSERAWAASALAQAASGIAPNARSSCCRSRERPPRHDGRDRQEASRKTVAARQQGAALPCVELSRKIDTPVTNDLQSRPINRVDRPVAA